MVKLYVIGVMNSVSIDKSFHAMYF